MIALGKNIPMWIKKGAKGNMVKNPDITTFRKFEIRVAFFCIFRLNFGLVHIF